MFIKVPKAGSFTTLFTDPAINLDINLVAHHGSPLVQLHGVQEEQFANVQLVKFHASFIPFIFLLCKWLMVMLFMKAMIGISLSL